MYEPVQSAPKFQHEAAGSFSTSPMGASFEDPDIAWVQRAFEDAGVQHEVLTLAPGAVGVPEVP